MPLIDDSLLQFFLDHGARFKSGSSILLACSGGPDSVALVRLLKQLENNLPYQFQIAHINHKLRGLESDADQRFTKRMAEEVGWKFHPALEPIEGRSGNLEEKARVQRYNALWKIARFNHCAVILTAHTLDDQVETVFLNILRGTGPEGLGGMFPLRFWKGSEIPLGRPFLNVSKIKILEYLRSHKFKFRVDRTNSDDHLLRNWMRRNLFPAIETRSPGFKKRLCRTACLIRDEQEVWEKLLEEAHTKVVEPIPTGTLLDLKKLLRYPAATQRRLIRGLIGKDWVTFEGLEGLRRWMQSPPTNGRFWQLRKNQMVERLSKSKGSSSTQIFYFKKIQTSFRKSDELIANSKRKVITK